MSTAPHRYITPDEYLEIERKAPYKSEYFNGDMFAMAGASAAHVLIVANVVGELRARFRNKDCVVYSTDLRVYVPANRLYAYPDIVVVCGRQEFLDAQRDTLTNPTVIMEVLSESTEKYDRGLKFELYRGLPSLREYVLIAQDRMSVERYFKQDDGSWLYASYSSHNEEVPLQSVGCSVPMQEIYLKIDFSQE